MTTTTVGFSSSLFFFLILFSSGKRKYRFGNENKENMKKGKYMVHKMGK